MSRKDTICSQSVKQEIALEVSRSVDEASRMVKSCLKIVFFSIQRTKYRGNFDDPLL